MTKLIVCLCAFILPALAIAKSRKPAQAEVPELTTTIQIGEKLTLIRVLHDGDGHRVEFSNSVGQSNKKNLNDKDFKTLVAAFDKLPAVGGLPPQCARAYIAIAKRTGAGKIQSTVSCFGMNSINAQAFVNFSNLLLLTL